MYEEGNTFTHVERDDWLSFEFNGRYANEGKRHFTGQRDGEYVLGSGWCEAGQQTDGTRQVDE